MLANRIISTQVATFSVPEDGTPHLLVLQQLDVQVSFGRLGGPGDVPQAVNNWT
jgi:hypothetical protein